MNSLRSIDHKIPGMVTLKEWRKKKVNDNSVNNNISTSFFS